MGRVLVIDDSIMVLSYVETVLIGGGHEVCVAEDWAGAREQFRDNEPFHVILVDVNLPGMRSGDHLAKSLRMHPKAKDSKVVFFSAEDGSRLEALTQMSGTDGYIVKGQGDDKFIQDVESFMPESALAPKNTEDTNTVVQKGEPAPTEKRSWWKR